MSSFALLLSIRKKLHRHVLPVLMLLVVTTLLGANHVALLAVDDDSSSSLFLKQQQQQGTASPNNKCAGKEWVLHMVRSSDSGSRMDITDEVCESLPRQEAVAALYGREPIVYGLETCEQFRRNVAQAQAEAATKPPPNNNKKNNNDFNTVPTVRVAGLYNTGTNAMAISLGRNLRQDFIVHNPKPGVRSKIWYRSHLVVPWLKHIPPKFRHRSRHVQDRDLDLRVVLPVVLVRDPYWWFQSMCKQPYDAKIKETTDRRCPVLVEDDGQIRPVTVHWEQKYPEDYTSLVALWNDWIRDYVEADFPRLMVRFEDQLFYPERVMEQISQCAGLPLQGRYKYLMKRSKHHGDSNDFLTSLRKYSSTVGRRSNLGAVDLDYADRTLDPELLEMFGYRTSIE